MKEISFVYQGKRGFFVVIRINVWYTQLEKSGFVEKSFYCKSEV